MSKVTHHFYRSLQDYTPNSFGGSVRVLRAKKRRLLLPPSHALGWDRYVHGDLNITDIDGNHSSIIMDHETAAKTADIINNVLVEVLG